jgi:glycolate oxidase FAD binding subunit
VSVLEPSDAKQIAEMISWVVGEGDTLEIVAGGTKRALGRPMKTDHVLDVSRLSGIVEYEAAELVLTAQPGEALASINAELAKKRQMLAFEPPDWRALLGSGEQDVAGPTLGGVLACNLSGPRRVKAGAARDHFLGFRAVSGRGEIFKAGGKVIKNVTGFDLPKLMAGSYGTLAALEEVTVKVLPRPEMVATLLFTNLEPVAAGHLMGAALGSPHEVSGAAYLPEGTAMPFSVAGGGTVGLRLEGPAPSVEFRCDNLAREHGTSGAAEIVTGSEAIVFWRAIGEAAPLAGLAGHAVWRISVAPARGAELGQAISRVLDAVWFLDWGGGLLWLAVPEVSDAGAEAIRTAIRGPDGRDTGHATLVKGSPALRGSVAVFEPQPAPLAALSRRVKDAFDPAHILNPGRMVEGS